MVRYKQKLIGITLTFTADKLCASFFIASKLPTSVMQEVSIVPKSLERAKNYAHAS